MEIYLKIRREVRELEKLKETDVKNVLFYQGKIQGLELALIIIKEEFEKHNKQT